MRTSAEEAAFCRRHAAIVRREACDAGRPADERLALVEREILWETMASAYDHQHRVESIVAYHNGSLRNG